jgi:hypothetical protein
LESRGGHDGGVDLSVLDLAQARIEVAAELHGFEVIPCLGQQGSPAHAGRAHLRAVRQRAEPLFSRVALSADNDVVRRCAWWHARDRAAGLELGG